MNFSSVSNANSSIIYSYFELPTNVLIDGFTKTQPKYVSQMAPLGEDLQINNFGFFVDKIKFGTDIPFILGSADVNLMARFVEEKFQESIELSGIVSLNSFGDSIMVENRRGLFQIRSEDDIKSCVVLHLRDYQRDCIYICGQSQEALAVGAFSIFDSRFSFLLTEHDALLVRGVVHSHSLEISEGCFHMSAPSVHPETITMSQLSLLANDIP